MIERDFQCAKAFYTPPWGLLQRENYLARCPWPLAVSVTASVSFDCLVFSLTVSGLDTLTDNHR